MHPITTTSSPQPRQPLRWTCGAQDHGQQPCEHRTPHDATRCRRRVALRYQEQQQTTRGLFAAGITRRAAQDDDQ